MRKYGGFIPGIRPGKNTAEYMNKILSRITVVGGMYLAILSLIRRLNSKKILGEPKQHKTKLEQINLEAYLSMTI